MIEKRICSRGAAGLLALLVAIGVLGGTSTIEAQGQLCSGDCDGNTLVSVDELVLAVNIALRGAGLDRCATLDANHDDVVTVDEIVVSVAEAVDGCPGQTARPTRTPTPLVVGTPTPTTPIGLQCGDGTAAGAEECDDGNTASGDGCDDRCRLEPGGNPCAGVPANSGSDMRAVLVAEGLDSPLYVAAPPLDPHRIFIVERPGVIRIVKDGVLLPEPFLDIADRVRSSSRFPEQGLLGLAFHPDFERNGIFFVDYTNNSGRGNTSISRFTSGPNADDADESSEVVLFTVDQPYENHNGGQLAFGVDGYLYIAMGDGGFANDPLESGQSYETLLGKILRVDVDVAEQPFYAVPATNPHADSGLPFGLIWAVGLRNPWRFSFDRLTRDLYIADVGQRNWEEINFQPANSPGDDNYGWDIFEGNHCFEPTPLFPSCPNPPDGYVMPVLEYDHDQGCSVTGGYVYRGCALPELAGTYFYGDYCTAFIRSFRFVDGAVTGGHDWTAEVQPAQGGPITAISSFGEDARGELYITDLSNGRVFKLVPAFLAPPAPNS